MTETFVQAGVDILESLQGPADGLRADFGRAALHGPDKQWVSDVINYGLPTRDHS